MALLATTALECTWGDAEPLIFLGEWCRRYERSAVWKAREHTVVRYHWDDREKLRRDHAYLKRLHKQILAELAGRLGEMHGLGALRGDIGRYCWTLGCPAIWL